LVWPSARSWSSATAVAYGLSQNWERVRRSSFQFPTKLATETRTIRPVPINDLFRWKAMPDAGAELFRTFRVVAAMAAKAAG